MQATDSSAQHNHYPVTRTRIRVSSKRRSKNKGSNKAKCTAMDIPKTITSPPGEAYVGIENPRGELGHYVVSDGGKIAARVRVRAPSFVNLAVLEAIMQGTLLADAIAIIEP